MNKTQNNSTSSSIDFSVGRALGLTAKVFLQEQGRTLPTYNKKIACDDVGKDGDGNEIKVDTVGRWLFGVPGYDGHIRVTPDDEMTRIYYPANSGEVVHQFLLELKKVVEK